MTGKTHSSSNAAHGGARDELECAMTANDDASSRSSASASDEGYENPVPVVRARAASTSRAKARKKMEDDGGVRDEFDAEEIFEHVRDINDPEHPYSLEQVREWNVDRERAGVGGDGRGGDGKVCRSRAR